MANYSKNWVTLFEKKNQFGIQVVVRKLTYLRTLSLFSIMLSMCTCIEITQPNFISILQYIVLLYYKVSDLNIIAILYCILLAACLSVYIYVCLSKCFRHIFWYMGHMKKKKGYRRKSSGSHTCLKRYNCFKILDWFIFCLLWNSKVSWSGLFSGRCS